MKIASYDQGTVFNPYNDLINELATYGVIAKGSDGRCEIVNPFITIASCRRSSP